MTIAIVVLYVLGAFAQGAVLVRLLIAASRGPEPEAPSYGAVQRHVISAVGADRIMKRREAQVSAFLVSVGLVMTTVASILAL